MQPSKSGREKQLAALAAHRVTQAPLDPASDTRVITLRLPQAVLEQLDAAAEKRGVTRSDLLREAIGAVLG